LIDVSPADPSQGYQSAAGLPGTGDSSAITYRLDDDSRRWIDELAGTGAARDQALTRLHELLLRVARAEVGRRSGRHPITGPELDDLAHQAANDALVAIMAKLSGFRGESRFTTWAYKFVVLEVSAKLGRHFWQRPRVLMDADGWDRLPDRFGVAPEEHAQRRELISAVRHAVSEQLTAHQREVFVALVVDGVPLDALVARTGSSRNAIYKTMFDARRKLHAALVANGHLGASVTRKERQPTARVERRP
jgi:RNA polymerase sigma-70 factor (ECF subfamily)